MLVNGNLFILYIQGLLWLCDGDENINLKIEIKNSASVFWFMYTFRIEFGAYGTHLDSLPLTYANFIHKYSLSKRL